MVRLRAETLSDFPLKGVEGVSASEAWLPGLCAPRRHVLCFPLDDFNSGDGTLGLISTGQVVDH